MLAHLKIAQQWCKLVDSGEAAIVKMCAKLYLVENGFAESLLQLIVGGNFQFKHFCVVRGVPYSSIIVHLSLLIEENRDERVYQFSTSGCPDSKNLIFLCNEK